MHLGNLNASCYSKLFWPNSLLLARTKAYFFCFGLKITPQCSGTAWGSLWPRASQPPSAPRTAPVVPLGLERCRQGFGSSSWRTSWGWSRASAAFAKMRADVSNKTFDSLDVGAWLITNNTSGLCAIRQVMKAGVDSLMSNKHLTSVGLWSASSSFPQLLILRNPQELHIFETSPTLSGLAEVCMWLLEQRTGKCMFYYSVPPQCAF